MHTILLRENFREGPLLALAEADSSLTVGMETPTIQIPTSSYSLETVKILNPPEIPASIKLQGLLK